MCGQRGGVIEQRNCEAGHRARRHPKRVRQQVQQLFHHHRLTSVTDIPCNRGIDHRDRRQVIRPRRMGHPEVPSKPMPNPMDAGRAAILPNRRERCRYIKSEDRVEVDWGPAVDWPHRISVATMAHQVDAKAIRHQPSRDTLGSGGPIQVRVDPECMCQNNGFSARYT